MRRKNFLLMKIILFFVSILTMFISCAKDDDDDNDDSNKSYTVISGNCSDTNNVISGNSCSLIYNESVGSSASEKNFKFIFSIETGGSLAIKTYTDKSLKSGLTATITRPASQDMKLTYTSKDGTVSNSKSVTFTGDNKVTLFFDTHNTENPTHSLLWESSSFNVGDALINSETDTNLSSTTGTGDGAFWGFTFSKAKLYSAIVSNPKLID